MVGVLQQSVCFFVMDRSQQWCNGWCVTTICVFTQIVVTHQPLHHCYDLSITKKHTDCCNTPIITPLLRSVGVMVGVLQQSVCFFVMDRS
jgi:hypothetical protein